MYESHARFVYSVCYQYLPDEEECNDLTSKIFLSLWERRDSLQITDSIKSYLFRAAKLQVFDYFKLEQRKANRYRKAVHELHLFQTVVDNEVWYRDLEQALDAAMDTLSPQRKTVFRLVKIEGMPLKEVADQLDLSPNTVKTHLSIAVTQLRDQLADFAMPSRSTGT
ncbi:MAG: sigma-70 family RNA polymerase sigma factor [Bacteroidota bacterium]